MHKASIDTAECKLLACRGCLATDVDLYQIVGCGLLDAYETIVGLSISLNDNYPQYLCRLCKEYMLKYLSFRRKCRISYNVLKEVEKSGRLLTTDFIRDIDRSFYNLEYSLICTETTNLSYQPNKSKQQQSLSHKSKIDEGNFENDVSYRPAGDRQQLSLPKRKVKYHRVDTLNIEELKSEIDEEKIENDYDKVPFETDEDINSDKDVADYENSVKAEAVSDMSDEAFNSDIQEDVKDDFKDSLMTSAKKEIKPPHKIVYRTCDELEDYAKELNFEVTFFTEYEQFRHMEERRNKTLEQLRAYYCHECYKIFTYEETLAMHLKNNHDPSRGEFICKFCKTRFKRQSILNMHLQRHSHKYTCKECGLVCRTRHAMKLHHEEHTGKTYMCHMCGKDFSKQVSYYNHVRLHHTAEFWCDLCGESFVGSRGVHYHKRRVHDDVKELKFKCDQCNKAFMYESALEQHKGLDQCDWPACVHCGDSFAKEMLLKYHLIQHNGNDEVPKGLKCEDCQVKFLNRAARIRHEADCGNGKLPCIQCGRSFITEEKLDEHSKNHETDKFKCEMCGQEFQNAYYFKHHCKRCSSNQPVKESKNESYITYKKRSRVTTDESLIEFAASLDFDVRFLTKEEQLEEIEEQKRKVLSNVFKCNLCGKNYRSQQKLDAHHKMHHDVSIGDHVCNICHMRFKTRVPLLPHIRSHRSRYSCRKCDFVTKGREHLKEHYNYHRGTKFICQYCNKEFNKTTSYMGHVRLQHSEVLSWCELCGESFIGEKGIRFHKLLAHKNEKDAEYVCTNCNKGFFFKSALEKHESLKRCDLSSCVKCGESFVDPQLLRYHLIQQHSVDSAPQALKCGNCKVTFLNVAALRRHAGECGDDQWPCVQCGENFNAEEKLSDHVRKQHDSGKEFKCEECNTTYANAFYFREHCKLHWKRIEMGIEDQGSGIIGTKRKKKENVSIETARNVSVQKKYHICSYCKKVFSSSMYLEQHVNNFHNKLNDFTNMSKGHASLKHIDRNIKKHGVIGAEDTDIEDEKVVEDEIEMWNEREDTNTEMKNETDEVEMEVEELESEELDSMVEDTLIEYDESVSYIEFLDESILED